MSGDNGVKCSKMDRRTNVNDEVLSGRSSEVNDDLVLSADQNICERQGFKIHKCCMNFHKVHTRVSVRDYS
jgi:hypothetical protein